MTQSTSVLLDILRIIATLCVFLGHCNFHWIGQGYKIGPNNGQDYVIIFFVLSGLVIAYVVDKKKDATLKTYLFDRFTRLYSVVVPALILTFICDAIGRYFFHSSLYNEVQATNHQGIRYILNLGFLQESWHLSSRPGTNAPFWSLAYEFWFYMLFGALIYIKSFKYKAISIITILLLTGYKIWILFPCWLIGVTTYLIMKKNIINRNLGMFLFFITALLLIALLSNMITIPFPIMFEKGQAPLFYSANFLHDYTLAVILAVSLIGFNAWNPHALTKNTITRKIKPIANCTFSVYLMHFPLLVFAGAVLLHFQIQLSSEFQLASIALIVLLLIYCVSLVTESQLSIIRRKLAKFVH